MQAAHAPTLRALTVIVYGKQGCSACGEVSGWLLELERERNLAVDRRDITTRDDWRAQYRYLVPVVEIEGAAPLALSFSRAQLVAALDAAREKQP